MASAVVKNESSEIGAEYITIVDNESGRIDFWETANYEKDPNRPIDNVLVSECKVNKRLKHFMETRSAKEAKQIAPCLWSDTLGETMQKNLKCVTAVQFYLRNWAETMCLNDVLQHCSHIKCLKVENCGDTTPNSIPSEGYPTLETVDYRTFQWNADDFDDLAVFFKENPNIKRFTCNVHNIHETKRLLEIINQNSNIEELFMSFDYNWHADFAACLKELKTLDDRDDFRRLEFDWNSKYVPVRQRGGWRHIMAPLSPLRKLAGLHFHHDIFYKQYTTPQTATLELIANLKILSFNQCQVSITSASFLATSLGNLEELHFFDEAVQFNSFIEPFVQHSMKLSKIFIRSDRVQYSYNNIMKLNDERKILKGSCKVTIYLDKDTMHDLIPVNGDMVNVKGAPVKYYRDVDDPHPLILYTFDLK